MKLIQAVFCFICLNFLTVSYAVPIVSNLTDPVSYFINHEQQMIDLEYKLSIHKSASLIGISGMGKSELARKYAKKYQDKYDLIWIINCNNDFDSQFAELSKRINSSNLCGKEQCTLSTKPSKAKKAVLEFLAPKGKWLLIFDNLYINQNSKVKDIVEWKHNGDIIICSQDASELPQTLKLPYFSRADSINVINSLLDKKNPELVDELVDSFKGYPVLVAQGAMFLNENQHMTVADYKKMLDKSQDKMKTHIEAVLKQLPGSAKELLYIIAVINNQQFSKKLLEDITQDKNFSSDLNSLIRFGVVNSKFNDNDNKTFEMHDTIKESVIKVIGKTTIKNIVIKVSNRLDEIMPTSKIATNLAINQDNSLRDNLEALLFNADKYEAALEQNMKLHKNLLSIYLDSLDYDACKRMEDWLLTKQDKFESKMGRLLMNEKEKVDYSGYLTLVGIYKYYDNGGASYSDSISYLERANQLIKNYKGRDELKFLIAVNLAQIYALSVDLLNAEKYITIADNISKNNPNSKLDVSTLLYVKTKIYLSEGKYANALDSIHKAMDIEIKAGVPQDSTFNALNYILEAEILNKKGDFEEAYYIAKKVYEQETKNIKKEHKSHALVLNQLAWAELGLGKKQEALEHIKKSIKILKAHDHLINDVEYVSHYSGTTAMANVVLGHVLFSTGADARAITEAYSNARMIYANRYGDNQFLADNVKQLYFNAAKNICKAITPDNLIERIVYTKFREDIIKHWNDDPRNKEILDLDNQKGCLILPDK